MRARKEGPPGGLWASKGMPNVGEMTEGQRDTWHPFLKGFSVMAKAGTNLNATSIPQTRALGT